jgi:hypothetical protein
MNALAIIFTIGTAYGLGLYIWLHTKPGKKWLNNL